MWLSVRILNFLVLSLSTTVLGIRVSLRDAAQTFSASRRIIGAVSLMGTSCSNVSSAEMDLVGLSGTTSFSSIPRASSYKRRPKRPNCSSSSDNSRPLKSATALIINLASFSSVTLPTPGTRPTCRGKRNPSTSSGWMTKSPSGFLQSEASFAKNLFGATPADAVRFNSSLICCRIVRATSVAVANAVLFCVTSR